MKTIDFKLEKNKEIVLNKKNINILEKEDKISFIINKEKYILEKDIFIKETENEIIKIDFKLKKCIILLKEINNKLELKISNVKINKTSDKIEYKYCIETEENVTNIITIEYTKK